MSVKRLITASEAKLLSDKTKKEFLVEKISEDIEDTEAIYQFLENLREDASNKDIPGCYHCEYPAISNQIKKEKDLIGLINVLRYLGFVVNHDKNQRDTLKVTWIDA